MQFIDRLAAEWGLMDVRPNTGETRLAIAAFEDRFRLSLPAEVRAFYERFNGLLDMDSDLNRFWSIGELAAVPAALDSDFRGIAAHLPHADEYFAFADHSISVFIYAVRLAKDSSTSGPVVCIAGGDSFDKMADTFADFWDRYLATPGRILLP